MMTSKFVPMGAAILKIVRRLDTGIYVYVNFVREKDFEITFAVLFFKGNVEISYIPLSQT